MVDRAGSVFVGGRSSNGTNLDFVVIKHLTAGTTAWTARLSGSDDGTDQLNAIALDQSGNVYVTGSATRSANTGLDMATFKLNGSDGVPV